MHPLRVIADHQQDLDYWASPDRNRRQKPQETRPALVWIVAAEERLQERQRQGGDLDDGHETTARDLPERCPRNVVAPEGLPSSNGRCVDAEQPRKLADSARCRSLPHGADQDDHGAKVYLPAEKTHRRRCHPLSAAVTITAEAEPLVDTPRVDHQGRPAVLAGNWHSAGDRRTSMPSAECIRPGPYQSTRGTTRNSHYRSNSRPIIVYSLD